MKKAAIAIDPWKQTLFEQRLREAGYTFTNAGLLTADCMIISVQVPEGKGQAFAQLVLAMNQEAARKGKPK